MSEYALGLRRSFEFRRIEDGATYRFDREAGGEPPRWRRTDLELWCRLRTDDGWVIVDNDCQVLGWPVDSVPDAPLPPAGRWKSAKAGKSYDYELVYLD